MLGVAKTASADEIKKAYRAAAMKWHPDRWVDGTEAEKKTAEEKFKEASEAYSVLSDPDKKAKYDQFGFAGVDGQSGPDFSGGFGNLNDILNDLFGGGFSGFTGFGGFGGGQGRTQQQRVMKGRDIRTRIRLTLEEIASGAEKEITIERNRPCPDCERTRNQERFRCQDLPDLQRHRTDTACGQLAVAIRKDGLTVFRDLAHSAAAKGKSSAILAAPVAALVFVFRQTREP